MADSSISIAPGKIKSRNREARYTFLPTRRAFSRAFLNKFFTMMTQTRLEGLENIPEKGPLLVLPNHLSNLDGPLVLAMYPRALEMVGPRDYSSPPCGGTSAHVSLRGDMGEKKFSK